MTRSGRPPTSSKGTTITDERRSTRPGVGIGISIVVGIAAVVIGWLRLLPTARDTMWAEDGRLFLQQRVTLGPWASLLQPYDGYQHLAARVLADVTVVVSPISRAAETVTMLSLVAVGATAAATYAFTGGMVRTRIVRIALSLVPVLLPMIPSEALGTFANLHWFALYLAPFALLYRPPTRVRAAWQTFALFAIAMTEIQSVVFLPFVALMGRSRRSWPAGIAFVVGLGVQVASTILLPRIRPREHPLVLGDTVRAFFIEPSMSIVWPKSTSAAAHLAEHGWVLVFAVFIPFVLAGVVALATRWSRRSLLVVGLAYGILATWFVDVLLNQNDLIPFGARGLAVLAEVGYLRYALVPGMFMLALVALAADRLLAPRMTVSPETDVATQTVVAPETGRAPETGGAPDTAVSSVARTRRQRTGRVALGGVGVLVLVAMAAGLAVRAAPVPSLRADGPDWHSSVRTAELACRSLPAGHRELIAGAPTSWGVMLACKDIDGNDRFP